MVNVNGAPFILYLPEVALEKIFSFLTYDEIAKNRIATLSIDNAQRVLILGISKDFGTCKSNKKNGERCNAIVNVNQCEYCIYHIKQEYQKCSKRSELQANFAGKGLIALRNKVLGKNEVFYAGKSYTAIPAKKSNKLEFKDNNRLQSLTGGNSTKTSLSNSSGIKNKCVSKKKNAAMLDVSLAQKQRDLSLLKKLEAFSELETKNSFSGKHSSNISLEESKSLALNVIDKIKSKKDVTDNRKIKDDAEADISNVPNFSQPVLKSKDTLDSSKNSTPKHNVNQNVSFTGNDSLKTTSNLLIPGNTKEADKPLQNQFENSTMFFIDLNKPVTARQKDRAKLNAIKFVQKNGGIKKEDPNSIRGSGKKRVIEDIEKTESTSKKSKLAESEFISDRFKKMMEMTSRHSDLLECRDDEEKEKYFKKLEMKEQMEEKMINTHKVPCKAVRCLQCKYTSFSASDLCKSEKHPLKVFDAMKRFFKCADCGNRTVSLEIIPIRPCKNCGSGNWQKCGMMKDKCIVPQSLSIRGGEQKFVNSVLTDCNINLLMPDNDD